MYEKYIRITDYKYLVTIDDNKVIHFLASDSSLDHSEARKRQAKFQFYLTWYNFFTLEDRIVGTPKWDGIFRFDGSNHYMVSANTLDEAIALSNIKIKSHREDVASGLFDPSSQIEVWESVKFWFQRG